jgi:hypothetical protein
VRAIRGRRAVAIGIAGHVATIDRAGRPKQG